MPKSKKTESGSSGSSKKPVRKAPAASPSGFPSIDTDLAAQNAARMLLRKPSAESAGKKESGAFKDMKESLNNPSLGNLDQIMNSGGGQRSNLPHQRDQQKGHNQTFSADVSRTGVPRRTPG